MKKNLIRCILSLVLLVVTGGVLVTYAWFSAGWNSGQSIWNFAAGTVPAPQAKMWLYSSVLDESDVQKQGWVEHTLLSNAEDSHAFLMPTVESEVSEGKYTFEMKSLQLGTVDNLVIMNQDNIIYLRFDFDAMVHGSTVATVAADLSGTLKLYDSNGLEETDEALKNSLMTIHSTTPFLQYQACVSTEMLSPDDAEFKNLSFSDETMFGTELNLYGNGRPQIENQYYIYIKIMPNLSAFAPASERLNNYMPCVILFDSHIQVTVH